MDGPAGDAKPTALPLRQAQEQRSPVCGLFAQLAGALAIYGATIGGSVAFGPLAGGALTTAFGWRSVFLINVPIGIGCVAIVLSRLRESRDPHPRRLDVAG